MNGWIPLKEKPFAKNCAIRALDEYNKHKSNITTNALNKLLPRNGLASPLRSKR